MPSGRVLNCAGAPKVRFFATDFRSPIDFRWYLFAVAWVTVIVSLSCAAEYLLTPNPLFAATVSSCEYTSSGVFALVDLPSRNGRIEPVYSGTAVIEPSFI